MGLLDECERDPAATTSDTNPDAQPYTNPDANANTGADRIAHGHAASDVDAHADHQSNGHARGVGPWIGVSLGVGIRERFAIGGRDGNSGSRRYPRAERGGRDLHA